MNKNIEKIGMVYLWPSQILNRKQKLYIFLLPANKIMYSLCFQQYYITIYLREK